MSILFLKMLEKNLIDNLFSSAKSTPTS